MGLVELILAQICATPVFYTIVVLSVSLAALGVRFSLSSASGVNPFQTDCRRKRRALVTNKELTDRVLKQGFTQKKVPEDLDAIVIGSGIGGLTTAAILAKTNKKVLVLEQHDQAGGCCHTFTESGYEFDVGIHYVGEIHKMEAYTRTLLDQISYGQIQWQTLDENYDTVILGRGESRLEVPLRSGPGNLRQSLIDIFPEESVAIDTFIHDVHGVRKAMTGYALLKLLPARVSSLLYKSGILDLFTSYTRYATLSTQDYVHSLTNNEKLQAVLCYCYGDYGVGPEEAPLIMSAVLYNHFKDGASYPVGGASQIALNIIPVIEDAGGRVLVRARVTDIIMEQGKAVGVKVSKGQQDPIEIYAPVIISDAGVMNTKNMLPQEIFAKSSLGHITSSGKVRSGHSALSLFVGLKGSSEELGLKAQNIWSFTEPDLQAGFTRATQPTVDVDNIGDIPIVFLSFPSTKDPTWEERNPNKSTLTVVTLVNYEWFEQWNKEQVKHRGESYEQLKDAIGRQLWSQVLELYPQLEGRVEYFEVGSPLTNNYYIGSSRGEIYGLDHGTSRFHPEVAMKLRPDIGIPGLYITGQDVMTCGFGGGMFGGLFCASAVLNRNVYGDCEKLHKHLLKAGM